MIVQDLYVRSATLSSPPAAAREICSTQTQNQNRLLHILYSLNDYMTKTVQNKVVLNCASNARRKRRLFHIMDAVTIILSWKTPPVAVEFAGSTANSYRKNPQNKTDQQRKKCSISSCRKNKQIKFTDAEQYWFSKITAFISLNNSYMSQILHISAWKHFTAFKESLPLPFECRKMQLTAAAAQTTQAHCKLRGKIPKVWKLHSL